MMTSQSKQGGGVSTTKDVLQVDAVIVGGGPCGLTLAKGLLDLEYKVIVIEKEPTTLMSHDWSKAYSYRLDVRGLALLEKIGLRETLINSKESTKSEGFCAGIWKTDGTLQVKPARFVLGSIGYWIIRPKLMKLLHDHVPDQCKIQGEVESIRFENGLATVQVLKQDGDKAGSNLVVNVVASRFLFGCDGIRSKVRTTLCTMDSSFETTKIPCVSAGVIFRASLCQVPDYIDPKLAYQIMGKTGESFSLLPYGGQHGEPRPICVAREPSYKFFCQHKQQGEQEQQGATRNKNIETLYQLLEEEFPQLDVRKRLSLDAAKAWCETEGSTFPTPRYAGKAGTVIDGVVALILGDALHSFPPDLGQGVNSGLVEVGKILEWIQSTGISSNSKDENIPSKISSLNKELVAEAKALCEILPIGYPYQYNLPWSLHKAWFLADFMSRLMCHSLFRKLNEISHGVIPVVFSAPAILEIQDDPPKKYTTIMENHHRNSRRLALLLGSTCLSITWWGMMMSLRGSSTPSTTGRSK